MKPTENIYLIGFMGCGKSTIARELEQQYGYRIIEMDQLIEEREGRKINNIFAAQGEAYFRSCETRLLEEIAGECGCVVSCGGGVAMRPENVTLMKQNGHIILLTAKPETILERVNRNDDRPLLRGHKNAADITAMLNARKPAYENAADFTVNTDTLSAAEIGKLIAEL